MVQHNSIFGLSKVTSFIQKGEGLPIIFLHGFCSDSSVWNDLLASFSNEYIVCIDLPGFGKSDFQENCFIPEMAGIVNAVLKELKIEKCILVGHSMGGYVALEFAKQFPTVISGLCLFSFSPLC